MKASIVVPDGNMFSKVVPLSKETHGGWSLQMDGDFGFARQLSVVPLVLREIPAASKDMPVAFRREGDGFRPVALLGLKQGENLFVDEDGKWLASYVPAILRQYPFVIGRVKDSEDGILSIDQGYPGFNQDGRGRRLFDDEGEADELVSKARDFAVELAKSTGVTVRLCQAMKEMEILSPIQVSVKTPAGETHAISGLHVVDRDKLKALPADKIELLLKTNCLEVIYLHLRSLDNLRSLVPAAGKKAEEVDLPDTDTPDPE